MTTNLALGFVLLAGLLAAPAHAYFSADEYLELLSIEEVVDEYGLIVFNGTIKNTHTTQPIDLFAVYIIIKKDGRIIARHRVSPLSFLKGLAPGATIHFSFESLYVPSDYDEFNVRLEGRLEPPDLDLIVGELSLVEESVYITTEDGYTVIYGEIFNGTNAIIENIYVGFTLLNARGDAYDTADTNYSLSVLKLAEVYPGETIDFAARTLFAAADRIKEWEVVIVFSPMKIVETEAIPTVSTSTTWGQIKQQRGGR